VSKQENQVIRQVETRRISLVSVGPEDTRHYILLT